MSSSPESALCHTYDLAMLDLDGVVYIGSTAVPGAAEHLAQARATGLRCAFITNNASRPPQAVAAHLRELGVEAESEDVVTSAQAAARVLVERVGEGARVVLLGADGLGEALRAVGLEPVGVDDDAAAVVSGYGPAVAWGDVMRAAVRIRDGLWWVASNTDYTIPTAYGVAPGHGVLVETIERFSGVAPVVAGKPQRPLLDETVRRMGGERPLMVGDRLDTDIEGARVVGVDSLLVMTGVTGLPELVRVAADARPTYLGLDLGALLEPPGRAERHGDIWSVGGWECAAPGGRLQVQGEGPPAGWWQVVAAAAWHTLDETGHVADTAALTPPEDSDG